MFPPRLRALRNLAILTLEEGLQLPLLPLLLLLRVAISVYDVPLTGQRSSTVIPALMLLPFRA